MVRKTLSRFKQALTDPKIKHSTPVNRTDGYLKQLENKKQVTPDSCMFC